MGAPTPVDLLVTEWKAIEWFCVSSKVGLFYLDYCYPSVGETVIGYSKDLEQHNSIQSAT